MGLLRSMSVVSMMTLVSRVMGFIRDMVVAHLFGAGIEADAFFVAFKLPNFMRRLFAEGAFSQAFVPVLSEYRIKSSTAEVRRFLSHMTGVLGLVLCLVTIIAIFFSPELIRLFAPGFTAESLRFSLASDLLKITFPYLFFISLTACFAAVLNTYEKFTIPAITPVLLNISMISCAFLLRSFFTHPIFALAWGVCLGGILQCALQLPFLKREKLCVLPSPSLKDPGVRRVLLLMTPAIIGVSVSQVNLLVDTFFASFLEVGSVSWLYYADRLMNFPLGVFGVAVATVVLPHLSRQRAAADHAGFSKSLQWAIRVLLFVGVPSAVILCLLSNAIITTLLQYGHFTAHSVQMTANCLIAFSLGVPFFMLAKVLASGFYAHQDIKTPVNIAIVCMLLNIVFNLLFITPFQHSGIALSTSLSSFCNVILLIVWLRKKKYFVSMGGWRFYFIRLFVANFLMALFIVLCNPSLPTWVSHDWLWRFAALFSLLGVAGILYLGVLRMMGIRFKAFLKG